MTQESLYSLVTLIFLLPLLLLTRRSVAFVFLASLSTFVVSVPLFRWFFSATPPEFPGEILLPRMLAIFLFSAGIVIGSVKARNLGALDYRWIGNCLARGVSRSHLRFCIFIFAVVWLLRFYRAASYGILFSGSGDELAIAGQSYFFVVLFSLAEMLALGSYVYLLIFRAELKFIAWPLIIAEIGWALVSSGRRQVIFVAGLLFFVCFVSNYKSRIKLIILGAVVLYFFVQIVVPLFLDARVNVLNYSSGADAFDSVVMGVGDAINDYSAGKIKSDSVIGENLSERGDVGVFLGTVIAAIQSGGDNLMGGAMGNSLIWAVPSVIIEKPELMTEQYIQAGLGMPLHDDSVSWLSTGYADFGFFGCFLYGLIFSLGIGVLTSFGRKAGDELVYLVGSVQAACIAYNIEADPVVLISAIRDMAILISAYYIFSLFLRYRYSIVR